MVRYFKKYDSLPLPPVSTDTESYMQKLYRTDKKFREKQKKQANKWAKDNPKRKIELEKKRYANRTPKQIQKRKDYLKKRREKYTKDDREHINKLARICDERRRQNR